jgi:hypothetical protein
MGVLQGLVSQGGFLYAAWKGQPDDDRIFYSRWSGSGSWSPASPMSSPTVGGNTSAGPSLGTFNNAVYAAWKGEWSDPRLFFAKFSGSQWDNQQQIPHAYSDVGPALCAFSGKLVAARKNFDQTMFFATYDGSKWSEPSQISGTGTSVGPSLASFNGKLYAIWKGESGDQGLWYASYNGTSWSAQASIPNVASSVGASLAAVGNKLYAVWKGDSNDERLWYATFDGTKWSGQAQIPGGNSSLGAVIAEFNGNLWAMAKGKDADISLYTAEFANNAWTAWSRAVPGNTGPDTFTTLVTTPKGGFDNYLLADLKSASAKLTGTTVDVIVTENIVTANNANYSFQINCRGPAAASGSQAPAWQQYGFRIGANKLFSWVNTFQGDFGSSPQYINWDSRVMPQGQGWVSLPNNTLPKDWELSTSLSTDNGGNVTGFSFSVTQADGTVVINSGPVSLQALPSYNGPTVVPAPINNMQVILVAENPASNNPGDTVTFNGGKGIFLCYAENSLTATASQQESAEGSNVQYSPLPPSYPNGEFFQFFGAPAV